MTEPTPVAIVAVAEEVVAAAAKQQQPPQSGVQQQVSDPSMPARTTFQQDLMAAGQRHINVKWESTQQVVAIAVTLTALLACLYILVWGDQALRQAAFIFLTNLAFLVVGTYFQRTNHTKVGGVGPNELGR